MALAAHLEGGDYARVARVLATLAGHDNGLARLHESPRVARRSFVPYARQLRLTSEHSYLRARGILPHTARAFEAGWWPLGGFLKGCIGVRLHDEHGRPLGYAGRRVDPTLAERFGKWKLPRGLPRSELLFNWHRVVPLVAQRLVVVEGPFDAMRVSQAGHRAVVALLGCHASSAQRALLATMPKLTIMLDADEAGRKGERQLVDTLGPASVRVVQLPPKRDPADLSDVELRGLGLD